MATKRVRRKETTRNNQQCLATSNNGDESDEKDLFSRISLDLKLKILLKLRAKDVAKFMFVSNLWSSIMQTKDFTDMYMARSSTRPRLLFAAYGNGMPFFHSCSQQDPSSDHHRVYITPNPRYGFSSPPINGLICCRNDKRLMVGNPSTGQFITLPRPKTRRKYILSLLGYDPVDDLYKVLCMTISCVHFGPNLTSEQHQVLSLGAKQKWRMIKCNVPHLPCSVGTTGICIDGVLYYLGTPNNNYKPSVISFDLRSEEFNATKLPEDIGPLGYCKLFNHSGKIAVATPIYFNNLGLWVLEDASRQEWSKTSFLIPSWISIAGGRNKGLLFDQGYT